MDYRQFSRLTLTEFNEVIVKVKNGIIRLEDSMYDDFISYVGSPSVYKIVCIEKRQEYVSKDSTIIIDKWRLVNRVRI